VPCLARRDLGRVRTAMSALAWTMLLRHKGSSGRVLAAVDNPTSVWHVHITSRLKSNAIGEYAIGKVPSARVGPYGCSGHRNQELVARIAECGAALGRLPKSWPGP